MLIKESRDAGDGTGLEIGIMPTGWPPPAAFPLYVRGRSPGWWIERIAFPRANGLQWPDRDRSVTAAGPIVP